jgi:hypothetical protein
VAVNTGSDTISVFGVRGDELQLRRVTTSGGTFPVRAPVVNSEPGTVPFAITGRVTPDDPTDEMRREFVELYRRWQHDRHA